MKTAITILGFIFLIQTVNSQVKPSITNKAKLAYLDSLLKVMQKKKNELAVLLNDFLVESQNLEKSGDRTIKGKTIGDRIAAVQANARSRIKTETVHKSLLSLERIVSKIKTTEEQIKAERDKMKDAKDSISEMNEADMLLLQQMMEKKNQLESMISNVMKAGYEGGQAAVQALKAS